MTTDLRTQLQTTRGPGYTLARELGGGGMSCVFVGVVVKVRSPERSASLSAEGCAERWRHARACSSSTFVLHCSVKGARS